MSCWPATAVRATPSSSPDPGDPSPLPTATPVEVVDLIIELREKLTTTGLDAGPDTIGWHLTHDHDVTVSRSTISRYLAKTGLVVPEPKKPPRSSYIRVPGGDA